MEKNKTRLTGFSFEQIFHYLFKKLLKFIFYIKMTTATYEANNITYTGIFKLVAACGYSHIHTMWKPSRIHSQNKIMTHFLSSWYIFFHLTSWSSWYREDGARDLDKILWLSCYNITCGSCKVAMPHLLSFSDSAMSNKVSFPKQNLFDMAFDQGIPVNISDLGINITGFWWKTWC